MKLRNWAISAALLTGCQADEQAKTWGQLECPADATVAGHLDVVQWCEIDGEPVHEWRTWHAENQAASAGPIVRGVFMEPTMQWWESGTVGSKLDGNMRQIFDEAGTSWGEQPFADGLIDPCPEGTAGQAQTLDSGHTQEGCRMPDYPAVGRIITRYPGGAIESIRHVIHHGPLGPEPQGTFAAWHPTGAPWVRGEFLAGKKHGPWRIWDSAGKIHQTALEPGWADHKPTMSWVDNVAKGLPPVPAAPEPEPEPAPDVTDSTDDTDVTPAPAP